MQWLINVLLLGTFFITKISKLNIFLITQFQSRHFEIFYTTFFTRYNFDLWYVWIIFFYPYRADIITLQEVESDQFYNFFLFELAQCGYEGVFSPKSRAKTMNENERKRVDGCAIFFKWVIVAIHNGFWLVDFHK